MTTTARPGAIEAPFLQARTVRSLNAIHPGTALHLRAELTSFVTYDKRLRDAAAAANLPVDSPS